MRLNGFDLNLLLALDVLLEERNVTRASERLHIGQSAASAALARLREYFGDELLTPVGRQLLPTPMGLSLIGPVRETLSRAKAAISVKPDFDPATLQRRFSIYASDYVTTVLLPELVVRLAKEAPGIALDIRHPPRDGVELFERDDVDLMIMPGQYTDGLTYPKVPLFIDTHVCIVWTHNEEVGTSLTFEQYLRMGHASVRIGDNRSVSFEEWFLPRYGVQRRIESCVDNFTTLPSIVIGTKRIATLHRRLAVYFAQMLPIRLVEVPFDMPPLVETLAWPNHLDDDPAHRWLRQMLLECASQLQPMA